MASHKSFLSHETSLVRVVVVSRLVRGNGPPGILLSPANAGYLSRARAQASSRDESPHVAHRGSLTTGTQRPLRARIRVRIHTRAHDPLAANLRADGPLRDDMHGAVVPIRVSARDSRQVWDWKP